MGSLPSREASATGGALPSTGLMFSGRTAWYVPTSGGGGGGDEVCGAGILQGIPELFPTEGVQLL